METMTRAMPGFLPDGSVQVPAFTLPASDLIVGEGTGHCHDYHLGLSEGRRDAVGAIVRCFRENLA